MREDTVARKVYVFDIGNGVDASLYDFTLEPGDTLPFYAGQGEMIVDSVGTVMLLTGEARKIFYLNYNQYYIEGIGGSAGLFSPLAPPEYSRIWNLPY